MKIKQIKKRKENTRKICINKNFLDSGHSTVNKSQNEKIQIIHSIYIFLLFYGHLVLGF